MTSQHYGNSKEKVADDEMSIKAISPIRFNTAICCIVPQGENFIDEFVLYHLKLGFNHIYLYDNSPTGTLVNGEKREPRYWDKVTVIPFPGECKGVEAYNDCMSKVKQDSIGTWIAFIDINEFVVLKQHKTIQNHIEFYGATGDEVLLQCVLSGSRREWYAGGSFRSIVFVNSMNDPHFPTELPTTEVQQHDDLKALPCVEGSDTLSEKIIESTIRFDPSFYLGAHIDLQRAGFYTEAECIRHYEMCGEKEGRQTSATLGFKIPWFICLNDNLPKYKNMALVAMRSSLLYNCLDRYCVYDGQDETFIESLSKLKCKCIRWSSSLKEEMRPFMKEGEYNIATGAYLRIDLPFIIEQHLQLHSVTHYLYTDCDIMFLRDPTGPFEVMRKNTNTFQASSEFKPQRDAYFNSGVMVYNYSFRRGIEGVHFGKKV